MSAMKTESRPETAKQPLNKTKKMQQAGPPRIASATPRALKRLLVILALPLVLVATWWVLSADSDSLYFPPLSVILETFPETWLEGRMLSDAIPSLLRLFLGYMSALVVGVSLGVAIGAFPVVRALTEPLVEFIRAIPSPVLVPILMIFLGVGDAMKIVVIAVGCVWPILLNTIEGVRGVDGVLRDTARTYKLRRVTYVRTVLLRSASPRLMTGARQALSLGIILMVVSEMFAANNGLGFTIIFFERTFAITEMWTGIILLGFIGVGLAMVFKLVEVPVLSWYRGLNRIK